MGIPMGKCHMTTATQCFTKFTPLNILMQHTWCVPPKYAHYKLYFVVYTVCAHSCGPPDYPMQLLELLTDV